MNDIRLAVFGVAISFAVVAGLAKGENFYHSDDHGYSISIPAGWQRVPEEIMQQQYEKALSAKALQTVIHDAEFLFESPIASFLIQVLYYPKLGMATAPRPDQFEPLIRAITGIDIERAKSEGVWNDEVNGPFGAPKISHISVDKVRHCYSFDSEVTMADSSKVVSNITGFFGRKAIVQLSFNRAAGTDDVRLGADWSAFADSFSFDVLEKYRVARRRPSIGENILVDFATYGLVAVGIAVVSLILRAFSKSKASKPD